MRSSSAAIGGKAGKAEERRRRIGAPLAIERDIRRPRCRDRCRPRPWPAACDRAGGAKTCGGRSEWPSASSRRASCGMASVLRPTRKKVACTHSAFSASSTFGVVVGQGPSSKVSTSSFGPSGSVCGELLAPDLRRRRGVDCRARARCRAHSDCPDRRGAAAASGSEAAIVAMAKRSNHRRSLRVNRLPGPRAEATSGANGAT